MCRGTFSNSTTVSSDPNGRSTDPQAGSTSSPSSSNHNRRFKFSTPQEVLDFSTSNWTHDFVTLDLKSHADILPFVKRPWFVLVFVQARLLDRWSRIQSSLGNLSQASCSNQNKNLRFEEFVIEDDLIQFGTRMSAEVVDTTDSGDGEKSMTTRIITTKIEELKVKQDEEAQAESPLRSLSSLVSYWITNDLPISDFLNSLRSTHLPKIRKSIRPCWDTYFTSLANLASLRSNCMKRRVGAVLVTNDKRVLSTGYNGTPRGMINCNEGGCARCNGQNYFPNQLTSTNHVASCGVNLEECLCLHAEENALLEAGRDRISNSTLYCNTCPCLRCSIKIVQCGVREVIYSQPYSMDQQAQRIFLEAGIKLRQFN